ncbi:MAG: NADPH-dependent assimilatory sulfite reductase hemoprotein subunit [Ktedonobacteraceae bacterium]
MPDDEKGMNSLTHLSVGVGSKVERIKIESDYLRGQIAEELEQGGSHFSQNDVQLLKFHGTYQQENRDVRQVRKASGDEKEYSFMVRSRIPGGTLTAEQYLVEDALAGQYADGTLRITTRQSFQLHGVLKGDLRPTIHAISKSLLSTLAACGDVNRNVMACPVPVTSRVQAQVQEIANRIALHLAPHSHAYHEIWIDGEQVETIKQAEDEVEPIYGKTYLPRKFKIGVAYPGDNCIDVYTQDIGLVASLKDEELEGFTVLIGGGMGMTHGKTETYPRLAELLCFATPDEVLEIVETIVTVQRDYGDRQNRKHARMKYVVEERGIAWFRAEVENRLGRRMQDPHEVTWHDAQDHLGWHAQGNGLWSLGIYVENGRIKDTADIHMRTGLRDVIEAFTPGVRLTPQQNILLTDIREEQRVALIDALTTYGIPTNPADVGTRRFAMACPALPTCGQALAEAERVLPTLIRQIEADLESLGLGDEPLSVRMTGCPNGCARPFMGDIGIVGRTKDIYNIYVGGDLVNTRMNALYAQSVHRDKIVATIQPLLIIWRDERRQAESFGDFCYRVGLNYLHTQTEMLLPQGS